MHSMHNSLLSGHLGNTKTIGKTLQRFYWYGLRDDIKNWIRKCDNCASNKKPSKSPKAPLGDMRVGALLDRIALDVLGPLPKTSRGNQYILVIVDSFSRWTEAYPMPDQTASTCANILLNEFISRFGCPLDLHSDQSRSFESNIFKDLCRLLEIRKTRSSPRHPQSNGQVERYNRTLIKMIRAYINKQENWDLNIGSFTGAYRATPNETTGLTPNMMMLGREIRMPLEVNFSETQTSHATMYGKHVDSVRKHIEKSHDLARKHIQTSTVCQQENYDAKKNLFIYNKGDLVWFLDEKRQEGICPKLQRPYTGPCVIINKHNDLVYRVQLNAQGTQRTVHHNRLKPYEGNERAKWIVCMQKQLSKR